MGGDANNGARKHKTTNRFHRLGKIISSSGNMWILEGLSEIDSCINGYERKPKYIFQGIYKPRTVFDCLNY